MNHDQILDTASELPVQEARPGEILIAEGEPTPGIFVLRSGILEVRRAGQLVALVEKPGAMVGEMAMLLDAPSSADVVARGEVELHAITDPDGFFGLHPELALFLARILAQRLTAVTSYLADLKERHGDEQNHLGLAAAMVDRLMASRGTVMADEPTDEELAALEGEA